MFPFLRLCLGSLSRCFHSRHSLRLENLALRQQLAVLKRRHPRPQLSPLEPYLGCSSDSRRASHAGFRCLGTNHLSLDETRSPRSFTPRECRASMTRSRAPLQSHALCEYTHVRHRGDLLDALRQFARVSDSHDAGRRRSSNARIASSMIGSSAPQGTIATFPDSLYDLSTMQQRMSARAPSAANNFFGQSSMHGGSSP